MAFLEALQDAHRTLERVWRRYSSHGSPFIQRVFNLSGRPFAISNGDTEEKFTGSLAIGLAVEGADGREYDLGVDLLWDGHTWTIDTEAWVIDDTQNQVLLRALPRRRTDDLAECLAALHEAVGALASFENLVFPP